MHMAAIGVTQFASMFSVEETVARLVNRLETKDIKVFARIDQQAEARSVGLDLRPTELVIFGDPKGGTPLMQKFPELALDLPLKLLVYQDDSGKVWVLLNSPEHLAERYGLPQPPFRPMLTLVESVASGS
jgi:uncharacterized protein (DUF302 family)